MGSELAAANDEDAIRIDGALEDYDDALIDKATAGFYRTELDALTAALPMIAKDGCFSHAAVIKELNVSAQVGEAVAWDKVRGGLMILTGHELMPVVDLYFRPTKKALKANWTPATHPEKYLAIGHGKKTAGAILVASAPVEMAHRWLTKVLPAYLKGIALKQKRVFEELESLNKLPPQAQTPLQIARAFALIRSVDVAATSVDEEDDLPDVDVEQLDNDE
jgi:hypothetical protein